MSLTEAGFAESACGAAGGDELDTEAGEGLGEVDKTGLVGNGEQGAADWLEAGSEWRLRGRRSSRAHEDNSKKKKKGTD